jgi:uncharacterized membrane protein
MHYRTTVTAFHPITHKTTPNVDIRGLIKLDDVNAKSKTSITASARTNVDGIAQLDFDMPADIKTEELELTVEGTKGLLIVDVEKDLNVFSHPYVIISTDKPLYQPGQKVFSRALVLGVNPRPISGKSLTMTVTDPDNQVVQRSEVKTSRFGIAKAEWAIPEETRLGDYELEFKTADDDESYSTRVKISRYDLPTFSVSVKPDRGFYLEGQKANVEIKADYLFGKPVTRGLVKLVRETERQWNYREQRYDTVEGDKYEGPTAADGAFRATIDLTEDQRELNGSVYQRFTDLKYAAYFTDESTNRTEQRRFYIRNTKEPIHVYAITPTSRSYPSRHLPLTFYISTFYADGTPARCNVEITSNSTLKGGVSTTLRRVRTNKYGVAKVENLKIPLNEANDSTDLGFKATARSGAMGQYSETFRMENRAGLKINTPKTIFSPGEAIPATIISSDSNSLVSVSVVHDLTVLSSQQVRLKNSQASLLLPYSADYKGEVTLVANLANGDEEDSLAARSVMFPRNRDLKLKLESEAKPYLPGENAHVAFQSVSSLGKAVESALGIVVLDQAVEERIRTDQEFGPHYSDLYSNYYDLFNDRESIGGITRKALEQLDRSKQIEPDLDLAAEVLLNQDNSFYPIFFGYEYLLNAGSEYTQLLKTQFAPVAVALEGIYTRSDEYPTNEASLINLLARSGIDFKSLKDPWGIPYAATFSTERDTDVLALKSAGPDKTFNTGDDFIAKSFSWHYFHPTSRLISKVTEQYHERTRKYIVDYETLRRELLTEGLDLDQLKDPWGQKYKYNFYVDGSYYCLNVATRTPNTTKQESDEEFNVLYLRTDYFAETRVQIDKALAKSAIETETVPHNESELYRLLDNSGVSRESLRDPFNSPYYTVFSTSSKYVDNVRVDARLNQRTVNIIPVTQTTTVIFFKSAGADRTIGTADDFPVATFYANATQQSATDKTPQPARVIGSYSGSNGAITGTIVDSQGAVVPGALCKAKHTTSNLEYEGQSNDEGKYVIRNLPAGVYELTVNVLGFKQVSINVLVQSSTLIEVNVILEPGAVTETVTVTGGQSFTMDATTAEVSTSTKISLTVKKGGSAPKQLLSTPRIRGFFPETLLWQPELTTDKQGRAQLDFKLADNITTWKMAVIGSTEDGEIGTAETEIRAFQPFFAELDPPRVLTQGDRISLPVVLRNYLDRNQTVNLELKPESWFTIDGPNQTKTQIAAGDSAIKTFNFQAQSSIKDGKQRVTALGSEYSDAIEKPVSVHPDGEERSLTTGALFDSSASLEVELPRDTIANSNHLELKIYPNLMSHVWESIEGGLERPHGCGEQTISSTYPSLLVLRALDKDKRQTEIGYKAQRYLEEGYQRLLNYQSADGGFSYWSNDSSDIALTAYAIRFLSDAGDLIPVSSTVVERAKTWLLKQQRSDGSWPSLDWQKHEDTARTALVTALVTKSIAMADKKNPTRTLTVAQTPLQLALNYLQKKIDEIPEPYVLACYSLAASLVNDKPRVEAANTQLISMAHAEGNSSYWNLETNTPFYGWGLTGRVETTALVLEALSVSDTPPDQRQAVKNLQSRALLFLLRNKDRYGVWYSGQATVNVLGAMLSMMNGQPESKQTARVDISVNGQTATSVNLPPGRLMGPTTVDLSSQVKLGTNRIQLNRAAGPLASVQVVNTYYVPWTSESSSAAARIRSGDAEALRLETSFNKTSAAVMEEVTCRVKAERIGFKGYGMLLAEIGLPPGADVDRESLESALHGADRSFDRYDVLPDRVVFYLWPRAGGSSFSFKFRPRLAMKAKSSQSLIYDYYNPEAKAVLAPETFWVR